MTSPVLAQAYALRAQIEALVMLLEATELVNAPEPGACPQCGAPADKVEDVSTIGQKSFRCTVCGTEWDQ